MRFLILTIAVAATLAVTSAAQARPGQSTIFQASREMRGDDAALRARTLEEISALGADYLRVNLYWHDVAPAADARRRPHFDEREPSAYEWSRYDRIVDGARAHGLRVLITITGPVPRWATRRRRDTTTRPRPAAFERFVVAVGRRYGTRVGLWSVWNEPNHPSSSARSTPGTACGATLPRRPSTAASTGPRDAGCARRATVATES